MIPFKLPQLSLSLTKYMEIAKLQGCASSCAGLFIGLRDKFFSSGIAEVDLFLYKPKGLLLALIRG